MMMRRLCSSSSVWQRPLCGSCLLILVLALGCGGDGRQAVRGTVQVDGVPLTQGYITFIPGENTSSPSAGGPIVDGRFDIPAKGGVLPGTFRVEITAQRKTGKKVTNEAGALVDQLEQYLPKRYNTSSTLTAEITTNGRPLEFALESR